MELMTFDKIEDAQKFLEYYHINECIINFDTNGRILIWVDYIKKSQYDREPLVFARC